MLERKMLRFHGNKTTIIFGYVWLLQFSILWQKSTVFNRERYMDFKKGIDKSETAGDRTLVDGDSGGVFRGVLVVVRKLRKH